MSNNTNNTIQTVWDKLQPIFAATEQVLNEWKGEGNLQFPILLGMMSVRFNWDDKQMREADPFVRFYVRNNPEWFVTRGAHGGIMRVTDKQKKEAAKSAKEAMKAQVQAALDVKLGNKSSLNSDEDDEENE